MPFCAFICHDMLFLPCICHGGECLLLSCWKNISMGRSAELPCLYMVCSFCLWGGTCCCCMMLGKATSLPHCLYSHYHAIVDMHCGVPVVPCFLNLFPTVVVSSCLWRRLLLSVYTALYSELSFKFPSI